jgi:hypothetical protein
MTRPKALGGQPPTYIGDMLLELDKAAKQVKKLTDALRALNLSEADWKEIISGLKLDPELRRMVVGNDILTDMIEVLSMVPDMAQSRLERELEARGHSLHRIRQSISQNAGLRKKVEWSDAKRTKLRAVKQKQ